MSELLLQTFAESAFFWSALLFLISCTLAGLGCIRVALKGEAITSLMGVSCFTTIAGVGLYLISLPELFNVGFARDTAIALLVLGAVGTIIFARMFRTEE